MAVIYVQNSYAEKQYGDSNRTLTDNDKLEFYKYYKQATLGKNTTEKPGMFSFVAKAKWNAWNDLGDMSKEDAKKNYVASLDKLAPEWKDYPEIKKQLE